MRENGQLAAGTTEHIAPGTRAATAPPQTVAVTGKTGILVHLAMLITLAVVAFFALLGRPEWRDDSDTSGPQVMQEIVDGHGWVLPLRNGRHIPVKPLLFNWLGALSALVRQSGVDRVDARLPSALLATLCAVFVYFFTRRLAGGAAGLWASMILITTPQFIIEARNSRVDMTFCAFLTMGLLLAHRVWESERGRGTTAILAGVCLGLATLSKGPLAFALTVMVFGASVLITPPARGWRTLLAPATLVAAIGLPALWYGAATLVGGWAFLNVHIYTENVSRALGEQGHWPVSWYIGPFFATGMPWMLAFPWVLRGESALPARTRRFLWVWVAVMFVFFSVIPGKRRAYLLVLRPALAILLAGWLVPQLARLRARPRRAGAPRALHGAVAAATVAGLLAIFLLRAGLGGFGASELRWSYWWRLLLQEDSNLALAFVAGIGVGADLAIRWAWQRRFDLAAHALVATLAFGLMIGITAGEIVRGNGASFHPFAERITKRVRPTDSLAFFDTDDDTAIALLLSLRRHVPVVSPPDAARPCEPPRPGLYLVSAKLWEARPCFRDARWQVLDRGGPRAGSERWRRLVLARYANAAE